MNHIHVDVDNVWILEEEFGVPVCSDKALIYTQALPTCLQLLKKHRSKATFFIVGKDLSIPACKVFCQNAVADGHDIANHSWSHSIGFSRMSNNEKKKEIQQTHQKIQQVCKQAPIGFRSPGYYCDPGLVQILSDLQYAYDCSVLPGIAQVLMKSFAMLQGGKNKDKTFGRVEDIFSPNQQYLKKSRTNNLKITELPISIFPFSKLPIHTTFAYYFGAWYQQQVLDYIRSKPKYLLYLFHAIDFIKLPQVPTSSPIIPLRYSFEQRMKFADSVISSIVRANHGRGVQTSRQQLFATKKY